MHRAVSGGKTWKRALVTARAGVLALALFSGLAAGRADAGADRPGEFDYYVLALSWSPNWCAREGDARDADQCDPRHDHGFTLHGLWPQHEEGWPAFCRTAHRPPRRSETAAMADIMGSAGLAWHQWRKHGSCTGLSPQDYFRLSRLAWERIRRPEILRKVTREMRLSPKVIEQAFLEANPGLTPEGVTVTCRAGRIAEVRICLTRTLEPRACGADVARDCRHESALFAPIR